MSSISPPTSFEPFPRLPIELRLKIWSSALDSYPAQTFRIKTEQVFRPRKHHRTSIHATAPQPPLSQTNQEARQVALEHFSQMPTTMVSNTLSTRKYQSVSKCAL